MFCHPLTKFYMFAPPPPLQTCPLKNCQIERGGKLGVRDKGVLGNRGKGLGGARGKGLLGVRG